MTGGCKTPFQAKGTHTAKTLNACAIVGREQKSSGIGAGVVGSGGGGMRACETMAVFTSTGVLAGWPEFIQRSAVLRSAGLGSF